MITWMFHSATLWVGMYSITVSLFWYESGDLATGLKYGLFSATLKSIWSLTHKKIFKDKELGKPLP